MKVAIIGAGASGLVSAIVSARNHDEVIVFEKNNDAGKKLLITGNGRCNYGNENQGLEKYHSNNSELIKDIINDSNINKVNDFFKTLGIIPKVKNGYFYPFSEKAVSIKSSLLKEAINLGVAFRFGVEINEVKKEELGFIVNNEYFDKVILATGSKCAPKTGSTGIGYDIATSFNHNVVSINPSLMQLLTATGLEKSWAGKRCEVIVSHYENDSLKKTEEGEIQFTSYGISGICIFNLSRDIRLGLNKGCKEEVSINFMPWLKESIFEFMNNRANNLSKRSITELCDGFIDYTLMNVIVDYLKIDKNKSWQDLNHNEQEKLCNALINFKVTIIDTKSFEDAQTCSGGIPLCEINLKTMESLKQKGLYFTGELIDLDGDCGGYNLTVAWITGMLAGEHHD